MKRPRDTDVAAATFLASAIGFGVWHATTGFLEAWTPNLGASCLEIAATIAIVDRIVRRESDRRTAPLVKRVENAVSEAIANLTFGAQIDLNGSIGENTAADVIAAWRDSFDTAQLDRQSQLLFSVADEVVDLEEAARNARGIVEPGLVIAISDFARALRFIESDRAWQADGASLDGLAGLMADDLIGHLAAFIDSANPYVREDLWQIKTPRVPDDG